MSTFDTPDPITVTLDVMVADVTIVASDRTDTTVAVTPTNAAKPADTKAAEQCAVDFVAGRLTVESQKQWKFHTPFGDTGSIDVRIELPAGSKVSGESSLGNFRSSGRLGNCTFSTSLGGIHLAETGNLDADTSSGSITVSDVVGTATIKNSNGETTVDSVTGDLRIKSANGNITIGAAQGGVDAKTANGHVRVGEVVAGSVVVETALGGLEIGVRDGSAAWLDLHTQFGTVDSTLDASASPSDGNPVVEVRARTSMGDISIRRSKKADLS